MSSNFCHSKILLVNFYLFKTYLLVACTRLYNPLCPSVGRSVTLCFFFAAPAHPHATKVAVYPALLIVRQENTISFCKIKKSHEDLI